MILMVSIFRPLAAISAAALAVLAATMDGQL